MLQAAYETTIINKKELIEYATSKIPPLLEEAIEEIKQNSENPIPLFVPYLAIIDMLSDNYTSSYLEAALKECLNIPPLLSR